MFNVSLCERKCAVFSQLSCLSLNPQEDKLGDFLCDFHQNFAALNSLGSNISLEISS
jgi:hypothetical protein